MIARSSAAVTAALVAVLAAACVAPPVGASADPYGGSPIDTNGSGKTLPPIGDRFALEVDGSGLCLDVQDRLGPIGRGTILVSHPCDKGPTEELATNSRGQLVHVQSGSCVVDIEGGVASLGPCAATSTTWQASRGRYVASTGNCLSMSLKSGGLATVLACSPTDASQNIARVAPQPPLR